MCDIFIYVGFDSSFINHKTNDIFCFRKKATFTIRTEYNMHSRFILMSTERIRENERALFYVV